MTWFHNSDPEWMKARMKYLTASDIKELVPSIHPKKLKTQEALRAACVSLWFDKHQLAIPSTYSKGDSARGHIMEKYAVEDFSNNVEQMHYWDNALIHDGFISFSPDAMDIPQTDGRVEYSAGEIKPKTILEIKSYAMAHHMESLKTDKDKLVERFQIAVAMVVCSSIEKAYLLFYAPYLNTEDVSQYAARVVSYTREELAAEIEEIETVLDEYACATDTLKDDNLGDSSFKMKWNEISIYDDWMTEEFPDEQYADDDE